MKYQKYVELNIDELKPYIDDVYFLDRKRIQLLHIISKQLSFNCIEKYYYISLCDNTSKVYHLTKEGGTFKDSW